MRFIDKLERRFGRYAINNISLMLIICYGFGYAISVVNQSFLGYLSLNPWLILHGQVWRLFTWILIPPGSFSFFTLISLYFYYWLGTSLEHTLGTFRYNLFLFSGMLFTVIGSFVVLGYYFVFCRGAMMALGGPAGFFSQSGIAAAAMGVVPPVWAFNSINTYYVNLSIFLTFALTFPEVSVLLFFIIPIKIKWLGVIYALLNLYTFVVSPVPEKIIIAASLANVLCFYLITRNVLTRYNPKQVKRRAEFRAKTIVAASRAQHRCAVCGQTPQMNPNLEFRFCSKCNGSFEYCNEHLFTHEHRK